MRKNVHGERPVTHEGAPAQRLNPEQQLRRTVMSCMLWEDEFYEDGVSIADRIRELVPKVDADTARQLAVEARLKMKLRHVPLLIAREMARTFRGYEGVRIVGDTVFDVCRRPDDMTEFLALYWLGGREPVSNQVKIGLARAFKRFDEYQLAKYDRPGPVRLRDVYFVSHPRPRDQQQYEMWTRLLEGDLKTPDTWETRLSAGEEKGDAFTTLLEAGKLPHMALLRNLRNMVEAGVSRELIEKEIMRLSENSKALPFRYVSAARACPQMEPVLDRAMQASMRGMESLMGTTVVLCDVSASMDTQLSGRSWITRMDAAGALAALVAGIAEEYVVYAFSTKTKLVPPRTGMALMDAIRTAVPNGQTYLGEAVKLVDAQVEYDRLIVFTDEQSFDPVPAPKGRGYMVNVASNQNGVGYGAWTHVDGFSERVVDWIREHDKGIIGDKT